MPLARSEPEAFSFSFGSQKATSAGLVRSSGAFFDGNCLHLCRYLLSSTGFCPVYSARLLPTFPLPGDGPVKAPSYRPGACPALLGAQRTRSSRPPAPCLPRPGDGPVKAPSHWPGACPALLGAQRTRSSRPPAPCLPRPAEGPATAPLSGSPRGAAHPASPIPALKKSKKDPRKHFAGAAGAACPFLCRDYQPTTVTEVMWGLTPSYQ